MIPTWGTSTGRSQASLVPSLLLDFSYQTYLLNGSAFAAFGGSPGITFSRGTNATMIDSTGTLTYAPSNQVLNSESFTATSWTGVGTSGLSSVGSNVAVAPDGTTTADSLVEDALNSEHRINQSGISGSASAGKYAFSIYLKAGTRTFARIQFDAVINAVTSSCGVNVNLLDGSLSTPTNAGNITSATATVTDVGNGWYRVGLLGVLSTVYSFTGTSVRIFTMQSLTGSTSFLGNGSNIFVWGAQFGAMTYETAPRAYNSTTPKNLLGRTEEFDNAAWVKTLANVTANSIADPNGNLNADTLSATLGNATILQTLTLLAIPYTFSIWLKRKTGTGNISITVDGTTYSTPTITTDWARYSTTLTPAAGSKTVGVKITTLGDEVYAWGAQLSDSASVDPYVYNPAAALTSTAYYGPRFDYNPNVEYSTNNLLEFPTEFSNAAWSKSNLIVPIDENTAVDPTGYMGAEKLIPNTTAGVAHNVAQNQNTTIGTTLTGSVYVKAAGYNFAAVLLLTTFAAAQNLIINLSTGAVTLTSGSPLATSVTDAGNGWWRISITQITNATGTTTFQVRPAETGTTTNFTGDGTSGIYAWGAQLTESAAPVPFFYYPYTPLGLLIEEARTNLFSYSEDFTKTSWVKIGSPTITADSAISPSGVLNADLWTRTSTVASYTLEALGKAASVLTYTQTFYVKNSVGNYFALAFQASTSRADVTFNLALGTISTPAFVTNAFTNASATIVPAGNGWYRCSLTTTTDTSTVITPVFSFLSANVATNGTDTASNSAGYIWGGQVGLGAFATSYIPTVGASATRSADVATMVGNNFTNWYNQTTGTLATSFDASDNSNATYVSASNGTITQNSAHIDNDTGNMRAVYYSGSAAVAMLGLGAIGTVGATNSIATAYAVNDFAASRNGGTVATDTAGAVPVGLTQLNIGVDDRLSAIYYTSGHIKSFSYFNSRLPDSSLQAITA
jgi:hypothetical protein